MKVKVGRIYNGDSIQVAKRFVNHNYGELISVDEQDSQWLGDSCKRKRVGFQYVAPNIALRKKDEPTPFVILTRVGEIVLEQMVSTEENPYRYKIIRATSRTEINRNIEATFAKLAKESDS